MTIKQQGGVFGRNPTFNDAEITNDLTVAGKLGVKTTAPWEAVSVPFNQKISVGSSLYPASFYRQVSGNLNTIFEDKYNVAATAMNFVMRAGSVNEKTALSILGTGDVSLPVGNLIVSNGKGIDFSATAGTGTSELFDDYEEGTWTHIGTVSNV